MLYRESGDFSETYKADSQTFPIKFDRYRYYAVLAFAFLVIPFIINDYWANAVLVPFLIYAIAAIGLNILVGYCGQVSLGTGGFMAVGAYACYKLMTAFPCQACGSRGFISRWPHWRRSSFWSGCSTGWPGSTITPLLAKSTHLTARSLDIW